MKEDSEPAHSPAVVNMITAVRQAETVDPQSQEKKMPVESLLDSGVNFGTK